MTLAVAAVNLRDCGNVGAIARTATAFGFTNLFTVGTTPPLERKEAQKAALGGKDLPTQHFTTLEELLRNHPDHFVLALETDGVPITNWSPPTDRPILLLLGNERLGLAPNEQARADATVSIPHKTNQVASLNVATSFGIAAYVLAMVK